MMKILPVILSIVCVFMLAGAYAQEPDKPLVKVLYNFIHIRDTTQRNKPYTENMLLLAGKNATLYTSYDELAETVRMLLQREELENSGFSGDEINRRYRAQQQQQRQFSSTDYYFFAREHKFYYRSDICVNGCLVEGEIEKIGWKIVPDTLNIAGIRCQKAIARFKGRNWIAWFDPEIPLASGPWKLNGLPGIILEAYDDKKEVQFRFAGMENIKEGDYAVNDAHRLTQRDLDKAMRFTVGLDESQVSLPLEKPGLDGGSTLVSRKDFERMKAAYDKDPTAFRNAQLIAAGAGEKAAKAPPLPPVKPINNPIELPEKQ